jgi:hypothetical protein
MKACLKVCGPIGLSTPARRATRRTIRAGAVAVHPLAVSSQEDRAGESFADCQVDRPGRAWRQWDSHDLAALAQDSEGAVAPLHAESLDVGAERLRDPQAVQGEERDEGVLGCSAEAGGNQQRTFFVAVEPDGVAFVIQTWAADMDCGRSPD